MSSEGSTLSGAALLAEAAWLGRLARSLVDEATADDVVQETYAAALRSPPRPDQPRGPWLATVLRNLVRMGARGQSRRGAREWAVATVALAEPLPSAEELLAQHQARRLVAAAVEGLDEPFRSTVLLCYAEGLAPSEIARRQSVPAGTVRWRLKRGLDTVREGLDAQHAGPGDPRRAWVAILAPLSRLPVTALSPLATTSVAGALAMGGMLLMKTKIVAALAVVLALLSGWWLLRRPTAEQGRPSLTASTDPADPTAAGASARSAPVPAGAQVAPPMFRPAASVPGETPELATKPVGSIEGTVRDDCGRPVRAAHVAAVPKRTASEVGSGRRSFGPAALADTDAAGRYRLAGLPLDAYAVTVTVPGFEPGHRGGIVLAPSAPAASGVDLALLPGGAILRGTVQDVGGGPVAGARVLAIAPGSQAPDLTHTYQATTGADGRYQMTLRLRGRYLMGADASGYAQVRLNGVVMDGDQTKDIVLEPAAQVSGQVLDEKGGGPAPGAVVRLARQKSEAPFLFMAVADQQGSWRVEGVVPGEYRVWARRGAQAARRAQPLQVEAAAALTGVNLTLGAGRSLRGRVRAGDGRTFQPVAGAELWFDKEEGGISQEKQAVAGADGAYLIEGVLPGSYRLRAAFPGHRGRTLTVVVAERDLDGLDLELSPEARIDGQVLTADGRPADKVRVMARAELGGGNRQLFTTRSQDDGRFVIGNLGGSDIRVAAEDRRLGVAQSEVLRVEVGERKQLVLRLAPGLRLEGRVREGSQPAPGVWVTALQGPAGLAIRRTVRADEEGHFVIEGLRAGETQVLATAKEPPAELAEIPPLRQRVTLVLPDDVGKAAATATPTRSLELALAR